MRGIIRDSSGKMARPARLRHSIGGVKAWNVYPGITRPISNMPIYRDCAPHDTGDIIKTHKLLHG